MPEEKDKIKKLYDTFVSDGYDMESEEDFRKNLLDSTKRKAAYDALVKDGYDMEPFEEFESNIGFGKERTSSQQSGNSASGTVEEPISPANEQTWQPTEKEKVAMLTETDRIMNDVKSHTQTFNERIDNMQEYGINPGLQTKEGKMIFNPESGKLEKTFLTPAGNRYYSKSLADMESFQYRQAADMSIGGQLRKANLRLQELKAKQEERASEVHKEWAEETENNKAPLAAILGAATYTPRQQSDKENRALSVAIRETEELIKNLEEQKDRENGVDVGFWRGFGRTMGDVRTWDFGMGDMRDAFTMMNADELKKENATEGEREAHDAMMGAIHEKQQAEERYSGNADFWNRAGVMTGYMPSFMLDFVLTGGGFNGLSSFSKGSTKLATKVISKETAEKMAQQGFKSYIKENGAKGLGRYATDWTIKALGTTADDLLVRAPLMANTVQAGKTTADIIDRKLGDVVVDENGNYDFSNDKTWGDAIWQSEANAIIENYSEMFGAHLDPVFTLGNMSKLANVVGAKRIGAVLSKADASALNGIMGQTHQMFNKMGVSDYVGEVSEEYYGQLWRTMLNLDDAYQQNPDGTRTNLFASGQFHGDIWGGMALSMGLMGAGKHTLSAANYTSMKHGVNKADAKVNELLGKEVWEPLKATLDLTTNENIGEVAELIAGDKDFTINEKAAVLDYMERSLNLRGFNLASMAQSRGGNRNESVQQANDSYLDGYNIISSQEMNDAKNMYEYQRARVADLVDESMFAMIEENPIAALEFVNGNEQWNDEDKVSVIDYINAKQVYNGMIQRVRDDIDGRIEQSNSMIDVRVNHNTGMIQGATMKQDERKVYVISGKLVPYDDGSGVSVTDSDNSIIIRDSETGALEQVSPDAVLSLDESQDPNEQKELAEQAIVEQFAREAADKIDGKVTFNPGDAYTITGQDGSQMQVQVIANEDGIVDNGDGTVNVSDGVNIFPLAKETIQQQADAANLARVAQFEQQRTIENAERKQEMQEAERPQYALNDIVSLTDENGVTVRGNITADADADGKYEVFTEAPINGKRVNLFTRDELDNMLLEHNGVAFERPAENESNNGAENIPENDNNAPQNIPAMQRIPKDEQGNPLYEQADSDTAWDAIVEQTEGDEDMAQTVADGMVADKEEALKKLEKAKSKGGNSIAEKIASEKERKAAIDAAKQDLLAWQKIAGTANRRRMAADAERKRMADEAAALRKAEEEKLRAEREEAERVEREALNGVPDMVDDTPQDARARGYRRVNGHKIDRQEPLQTVQGKEVNVKFSNDVLAPGHVAVIDASLLQPSHIQGVRNPLHFIDEAQPKERNDEASVLSARKIAGNIRPEEITSSITAYTGAPTVNERGEVIQGNNRSDALRLMWESHPEQAEAYRQYLKDHAEEFGLRAEDIAALQSPVLVNMLHVDDATAIPLGQYVAQDTESGGVERIKPKNALQRMGIEVRSFANLLLRASDDEVSFAGLVDANGASVLKWMSQRGFISPTQYKSAFDSKGNLTPESKNDLRGIMYQSIFKDGSTRLEEMFNVLPVKAQKAILATAFRDYDSPNSERMVDEIQNSVRAYYALSQDKMFAEAKNFKEARTAVESWKRQYQMDDVTGESYLPADNFSNFVLHLAAMYKGESQSFIQNTFGKIYDLIQGTQEETLFEQPDNTPRTLVQAIKEALNLDYNGQQRSNVLVGDTATSQRGQQGSNGTLAPRERVENGNDTTDILQRNGIGAYNDDEVSYENDPVAKLLGQSRRTAKQRREFARRERQRMAERVESLAEKLHLDNVEVVTDASVLDGKKQRAKGFYSKSTGKITIVIPNHTSTFDVEQTLLHEAVAHYGLRQLFGEHFDTFLDNVFNNADENIRRRIVDMAAKNGWDFHKATEEYLASLAEETEFENINASWWQQIKDFFLNMLHKIGFEDFRGVTLSDNELRYILWRSYENLAEPGRYRNILGEAADVAKQYELKVGNYAVSDPHHQTVAESDDALYRTGDPEIHERELARDRYERRVKSGMFQSQEALQDSMLGLKEAMTAILGKETNIEDVDGFENAYLGENRLSSVNKAEADAFAHTLFKPMLDEVAKLARTEAEREELTDYMMAKHGLERNTYMRNEAINNGATDADQTDYAGLTALTGMDNVTDAETEAQIMVNDYEQAHDTTDLWKKVNAASKAILSKSYECGMMSKATFDKISDMYDFYIPLRGFDEKTSSEAYAYLTHKQSAFNAPIKKAEGRRSKADDPFANLQSMAEGAIMQGNRNKLVKQRFLNFALNHSSDLVSVSDIWVEYDTVADEWKPVFPDNIDSTDTPEVVERKMLDFETKMESLAQQYPDRYKHGKDTVNIPYRIVESQDMRQHQIVVKRGGRDYVITINGNPRAAQALNGQTNPDNDMSGAIGAILRAGENINRQLSAFYTTRNPDFIVSNFMRDMLYTNTMTWIRESPNYALRFHRNYMYANPVRIKQLLAKHRKGTLDMSNKTEAMFHQFMMNGGETGYANIRDIEQHKNDIRRELKKSNGKIPVKKAWDLLGERFDEYNRAVENCARFAAFMTSREMGRSIDRAIYDAKEISVNFNKKGSGAKFYDSTGQTKAGNASALVSGLGRSGYVFWNAAIQGTANFGRQMKRHPAKAFTGIAAMFLLGAIVAYLGGDDDDDDDKNAYYNLPEYVRRSNILFRAGNSWVSIPLPVEYRAVYGMGELMISVLNGKEHLTGEEIAEAITGQATQILPIDFLEGGGGLNAFVPSAYKPLWEAYVAEKSWTGMPLYKDTPYNKDMPEWTKAYKSANKYIVGLANAMNEATGGDPYTKGTIDFNPAKIEYMLNGYFGGVFGTIDKLSKTAETITDNREYDPRSFLLVNRLVKAGDERTEYRAVNNEYFRLKEEHDRLKSRLKHYEEDTDNDIFDYAEKIDFLYNSPEYERYEIFEDYRRDIDDLYNELNDTVDDEERKNIEAELNELKKEMIEEMNKTRK
jgi:hypothetical protein